MNRRAFSRRPRPVSTNSRLSWSTGGRTMKHSSIVFLPLFAAIVSTAPAEGQDEKAAVTQAPGLG